MFLDAAVVAIAVRTTARTSAVLLAANLISAARRLSITTPTEPDHQRTLPPQRTQRTQRFFRLIPPRPRRPRRLETTGVVMVEQALSAKSWRSARELDMATFVAFLVSHTIHFACVALLALATGGASIRDSGGWPAAMVVATLFYLSGWGVFRGKRRPCDAWTSTWQRRREIGVLIVVWLIFFLAFAPRAGTPAFAVLSVGLVYSLVRFLTAALRSPADAASHSAPASV